MRFFEYEELYGEVESAASVDPKSWNLWNYAARKIINKWRSHFDRQLYFSLRDLVVSCLEGNPQSILKCVNPVEASLMDVAFKGHCRFRLGGIEWPPQIYYKIFTHGSVIDINAFAPRDYNRLQRSEGIIRRGRAELKNIHFTPEQINEMDGFVSMRERQFKDLRNRDILMYERAENNGWRPIANKSTKDEVERLTAQTRYRNFRFDPKQRRIDRAVALKAKKLNWIRKLYSLAQKEKEKPENDLSVHSLSKVTSNRVSPREPESEFCNSGLVTSRTPRKDQRSQSNQKDTHLIDHKQLKVDVISQVNGRFDDDEINDEELIKWASTIDYIAYENEWSILGCSAPSDHFMRIPAPYMIPGVLINDGGAVTEAAVILEQDM